MFDWTLLIPLIVPIALAGLKYIVPKIPKAALPILAPVLGAAVEIVGHYAGLWAADPVKGAIFGALGVFIREVYDQLRKANIA